MKGQRPPTLSRNVLHSRGSPVRSVRWKNKLWDELYQVESEARHQVKPNRIAEIAVHYGLVFLQSLDPLLRARVLGVKAGGSFTFQEEQKLHAELKRKLGSAVGQFRFDDRLSFALPRSAKDVIREEAERSKSTMSAVARRHILLKQTV